SRGPGRLALRPACDVTNTRPPQTIGDETPTPPSRIRHAMFEASLQDWGSPVSDEAPVPAGPRQCGQFSADTGAESTSVANAAASERVRAELLIVRSFEPT